MIFRTCPKCSHRWTIGDGMEIGAVRLWYAETKHTGREDRRITCWHKGTRDDKPIWYAHQDTIKLEIREHAECGGLMYDQGSPICRANMIQQTTGDAA